MGYLPVIIDINLQIPTKINVYNFYNLLSDAESEVERRRREEEEDREFEERMRKKEEERKRKEQEAWQREQHALQQIEGVNNCFF